MIRAVLVLFFAVPALFSQIPGGVIGGIISPFPPQLKQYLELTDEQVASILRLNSSSQTFQLDKLRRSGQVQFELSQEMAKPTLDPMALGVRYEELEAIRREIEADGNRTAANIQNVLTTAQKTKVAALQQAMQLQSVICEAQSVNVLRPVVSMGLPISTAVPANRISATRWFDTAAFLLPGVACGSGIRTGFFSPSPVPPSQP
jgi:hypothetical protein